ncbi:hypothetical protein BDV12DRAFT_195466 [Aspergillus spectabilis]
MIIFSLHNPYSLSLDKDGPTPVLFRLLTTKNPPIETIDLTQFSVKRILLTGATGGCGIECARALAGVGCHLIRTARSREKGAGAVREIMGNGGKGKVSPETKIDVEELDWGDWGSIKRFGERIRGYGYLDVAVMNAGVYCTGFEKCEGTGVEEMVQVNVLSTIAISLISTQLLLKSPDRSPSRLLFISSEAHGWANPRQSSFPQLLKHLNEPTEYKCYMRYHISKLLLVLWMQELSQRINPEKVLVAAASPGFTRSGLFRGFNDKAFARAIERVVCRTSEQGAVQYLLVLNGMSEDNHGEFWSDGRFRRPSTAASTDVAVALRESMWEGLKGALPEFLSEIGEKVLENRFAARTPTLLTQHGITHILSIARWQDLSSAYTTFPGTLETNIDQDPMTNTVPGLKLKRKYVELDDDPAEDLLRPLERMLDWIHDALTHPHPRSHDEDSGFHPETDTASHITHTGGRVLIHCNQGISRSGAVVIAYIMRTFSLPYAHALALARESRSIVNPNIGFEYQLRIWEGCAYEVFYESREHLGSNEIIIKEKAGYRAWRDEVASVHTETRFLAFIRAREDWLRSLQARLEILNC